MQGVMKIFETSNLLVKAVPIQPLCEMQLTYFSRRRMQHWPHVKKMSDWSGCKKFISHDKFRVRRFKSTKTSPSVYFYGKWDVFSVNY